MSDLKAEVTVNDSGFEDPTDIKIEKTGDIPMCSLTFPKASTSRYRISKKDIIKVYVGIDDVPNYPNFIGYQDDETGIIDGNMELYGLLNAGVKDFETINDYNNLQGLEISNAITQVKNTISKLASIPIYTEKTNPVVRVPDDFLFENGIAKYELMKELRDLATDPADPLHIGRYTLFQHGEAIYFRKIPNPQTADEWIELFWGSTIIELDPQSSDRFSKNKQRVYGKDGAYGVYQNAQRVLVDGIQEDKPISDNTIKNNAESFEVARASVLSELQDQVGLLLNSQKLIDAVPNQTVVSLPDAPYGFNDKYLLRSLSIEASSSSYQIFGTVTAPTDIISDTLTKLLNLDTSPAFS